MRCDSCANRCRKSNSRQIETEHQLMKRAIWSSFFIALFALGATLIDTSSAQAQRRGYYRGGYGYRNNWRGGAWRGGYGYRGGYYPGYAYYGGSPYYGYGYGYPYGYYSTYGYPGYYGGYYGAPGISVGV